MKVEKVGWYRTRGGELAKVKCILKYSLNEYDRFGYVADSKISMKWSVYGSTGTGLFLISDDLVEYLGYKKPKSQSKKSHPDRWQIKQYIVRGLQHGL